jgi:hypothetical protein
MITSTGTVASQHLETGSGPTSNQKIKGTNIRKIIFVVGYRVCNLDKDTQIQEDR